MPRSSIETLLHAFVPYTHVDHTDPDATNMICCAENGELAWECFGDGGSWGLRVDTVNPDAVLQGSKI